MGNIKTNFVMIKESDSQKKSLEAIFRAASYAPIFKQNPKYCLNQFAELTPYISYIDLKKNKLMIKGSPVGSKHTSDTGRREVIVEYATIDELLNDGWQLD